MNSKDLDTLITLRKDLHRNPEVSGQEGKTAKRIKDFFQNLSPDQVVDNLGGHGIAFIYEGLSSGPTTMFRCELDGLPIKEQNNFEHNSTVPGTFHGCGHDGHMAMLAGLGIHLAANKPKKGKIILLFQPAEETGEGAERVINSQEFQEFRPDFAFAIHNLPGYHKNQIVLKSGPFAAASKGIIINFHGKTSHAAHPENGNSPAKAMCNLIIEMERLSESIDKFSLVTVVHAKLGNVAFGTTPGEATIMATLRAYEDEVLDTLTSYSENLVTNIAKENNLLFAINITEAFAATINDSDAHEIVLKASNNLEGDILLIDTPFRWSEDFGHFSKASKTALIGLGAGKNHPQLHEPTYDFPDEILGTGINLFLETIKEIHN